MGPIRIIILFSSPVILIGSLIRMVILCCSDIPVHIVPKGHGGGYASVILEVQMDVYTVSLNSEFVL